jgi:H+/Cl- antiporter ClcA
VSRTGQPLGPEILRDDRRGLWIVLLPASSFIQESVEERRPALRLLDTGRWSSVDALALALIAIFYGALGYVLWQLSLR